MLENIISWLPLVVMVSGWVLYFRENQKYRDAITDLLGVMHDHDVDADELRRTEDHRKVKDRFE